MFLISPTETKDLSDYNGKLDSATRSEVHRKKRLEGTWTATSKQIPQKLEKEKRLQLHTETNKT